MPQYSTRQTSYLRIAAYKVLQMVLYIEEDNVSWMNDDVLERLLYSLKDRIPVKLSAEMAAGRSRGEQAKDKNKIEVYRGADFQIAYFFRKMAHRHAVLLKDKQLTIVDPSIPEAKPEPPVEPKERPRKRTRIVGPPADPGAVDLTHLEDGDHDEPVEGETMVVIKDEDEDVSLGDFQHDPYQMDFGQEEDVKPDVKPQLNVNYTGYNIWGKSLVVIVEPYPPLSAAQKASGRRTAAPTEIRQLSTSVAPESYRASGTPVSRRRRNTPLFRSETTPLDEEDWAGAREALRDSVVSDTSEALGGEEEEELPTLSQVKRRVSTRRSATPR